MFPFQLLAVSKNNKKNKYTRQKETEPEERTFILSFRWTMQLSLLTHLFHQHASSQPGIHFLSFFITLVILFSSPALTAAWTTSLFFGYISQVVCIAVPRVTQQLKLITHISLSTFYSPSLLKTFYMSKLQWCILGIITQKWN